jgi:hypothetical protein
MGIGYAQIWRRFGRVFLAAVLVSGCSTAEVSPRADEVDAERAPAEFGNSPVANFNWNTLLKECATPTLSGSPRTNIKVNNHILNPTEARNVQWVNRCILPNLPGSAEEQAIVAAKTTWWALREGIMDIETEKVFRYSNCTEPVGMKCDKHHRHCKPKFKDRVRSSLPLWNCPTNIWQVGISAGQVANYSESDVTDAFEKIYRALDPRITQNDVIRWTAILAGFPEGSPEYNGIMKSTGRVRHSWLVRNPLIGFLLVQDLEVQRECMIDHRGWCFGKAYPAEKHYAPTRAASIRSIADLKRIFLLHTID